jgi:hypothetical protein
LKRWTLAFSSPPSLDGSEEGSGKVFFDFERDILWVAERWAPFKSFLKNVRWKERSGLRRIAMDFNEQVRSAAFRSGRTLGAVLIKEFPLLEEVILVGGERSVHQGARSDGLQRGPVAFVENVDGYGDVFQYTRAAELDGFRDICRLAGKQNVVLKYMDYTRDDPRLFETMDKLQWLQMED